MAQQQHLEQINEAIEKHDIAIWNKWRQENPDIQPDLSGAKLKHVDLKEANLNGVIFKSANLRGSDLSNADLHGSDLDRANLVRTHFSAANLAGAHFNGADLSEANLSMANLCKADFSQAHLLGALLQEADLDKANLEDNVKELSPFQIKTAKNWENAYYDKDVLERLGLPPDHNEKLRNEGEMKAG
jgi:uncharacterized protein YjbI with pentapeptide repeats